MKPTRRTSGGRKSARARPPRRRTAAEPAALVVNPTLKVGISLQVARRGLGLLALEGIVDPDVAEFVLYTLAGRKDELRVTPRLQRILREHGVLITPDERPREVVFTCPPEPELAPLLAGTEPPHPRSLEELQPQPFVLQRGSRVPPALAGQSFLPAVQQGCTVAWTHDPGTDMWTPFWLDPKGAGTLRKVLESRKSAGALSDQHRRMLAHARLLAGADYPERRRAEVVDRCAAWAASLRRDGYVVLRDLLNPVLLASLRRYYRALDREGYLKGGNPFPLRPGLHNEPTTRYVHHQLVGLVNRIVPSRLMASYCYVGFYRPRARLPRHRDREQCEWNLSLALDADPTTDATNAWPIVLEIDGAPREVRLGLGDGLLYRGTEVSHWRDEQPAEQTTTVGFFHFVRSDFAGSLD